MDYPKMLFRKGGDELCHDLKCETMVVENEEQEEHALADGYAATPQEAHGKSGAPKTTKKPDSDVAVLEEHIKKLEGLIGEANKRITENEAAAQKAAQEATELLKAAETERDEAKARADAAEKALAGASKDKK